MWRLRRFPGFTAIAKVAGSWCSAPHAEATWGNGRRVAWRVKTPGEHKLPVLAKIPTTASLPHPPLGQQVCQAKNRRPSRRCGTTGRRLHTKALSQPSASPLERVVPPGLPPRQGLPLHPARYLCRGAWRTGPSHCHPPPPHLCPEPPAREAGLSSEAGKRSLLRRFCSGLALATAHPIVQMHRSP